jgi:hypothetical protein
LRPLKHIRWHGRNTLRFYDAGLYRQKPIIVVNIEINAVLIAYMECYKNIKLRINN